MKIYLGLEIYYCLDLDTTELSWTGSLLYYPERQTSDSEQKSYELLTADEMMIWQEVLATELLPMPLSPALGSYHHPKLTSLIDRLETDFYGLLGKIATRALSLSEQEGRDFQRRSDFLAPKEVYPNLLTVGLELKIELGQRGEPRVDACSLLLLDAGRHHPVYLYQKKINLNPVPDRLLVEPDREPDELVETLREIFGPSIQAHFVRLFDLQSGRLRV
jgi:hypothetical protein